MPKGGKEKFHELRDMVNGTVTLVKKDSEEAKNLDRHKRETNSSLKAKDSKMPAKSRKRVSDSMATLNTSLDRRFPSTKKIQVTPGEWKTTTSK